MKSLAGEKLYYVYGVRVIEKGTKLHHQIIKRVKTKRAMDAMQRQLVQQYQTAFGSVAFEFEDLPSVRRLSSIVLNEIWNACIIEWKSKNLRQCLQKNK